MKTIAIRWGIINLLIVAPLFILCATINQAHALTFKLPPKNNDVVGEVRYVQTESGDNFEKLARRYDVGFHELSESNPHINPFKNLHAGVRILLPTQYILPPGERKGIVVNLAELRMYHYMPEKGIVATYPVGAGRINWPTPLTPTKVKGKKKDPAWYVPKSIQRGAKARGVYLPDVVPPGPKNPLGRHAIYLQKPGYLFHGTIAPEGVGKRVSHGCLRLFPEDVEELYNQVEVGAPVRIIHEHSHVGWVGKRLYVEVHKALKEHQTTRRETQRRLTQLIYERAGKHWPKVDWEAVQKAIKESKGVPVLVAEV